MIRIRVPIWAVCAALLLGSIDASAQSQQPPASMMPRAANDLNGHFGMVLPLVTSARGQTTTLADNFVIGFPFGVLVTRKGTRLMFDVELMPMIQKAPLSVDLTVQPGLLVGVGPRTAVGGRLSFEVGKPSWGFAPLYHYNLVTRRTDGTSLFTEVVAPIRFRQDQAGDNFMSVGLGVALGVLF